jgi:hypothetical protein
VTAAPAVPETDHPVAVHAHRVALSASILLAVAGAAWSVVPSWMPFTGLAERHVNALLPAHLVGVPLVLLGVVGTAVLLGGRYRPRRWSRSAISVVAVVEAAVLGTVYQGPGTVSVLGYLAALCLPFLLVVLLALVVVRMPGWRWPVLLVTGTAVTAGVLTDLFSPSVVSAMYRFVGTMAGSAPFVLTAMLILVALVAWVTLLGSLHPGPVRRMTAAVVRNRCWITVAAAACALPYFLLRFLWLTPFHVESLLGLPGSPDTLDPAVRLWGVSLGAACLIGAVLTLGLIRPWGEVFPRWVPGVSGRSVPVALAAVPGLGGAGARLGEAPALLLLTVEDPPRSLVVVLVFPFPLWGPLLALATWGYVGHRLSAPVDRADGAY